jgi:putative endonuclease
MAYKDKQLTNDWTVYILYSECRKDYYVGITTNMKRRLSEHNRGKCRSTKHANDWTVHVQKHIGEYDKAIKLESYLNGYGRYDLVNVSLDCLPNL